MTDASKIWAATASGKSIVSRDSAVLTTGVVGSLITGDVIYWGGLMAGALVAALPPIVVYAFLMDYYVSGLTTGATKG